MNNFSPINGTEPEWKEARSRVEAYLTALQLTNPDQRERVTAHILQQAAARHAANPHESPTALAMNEINARSEEWLEKILPSQKRLPVAGLVSLFAVDATKKWPAAFLTEDVPTDFQHALEACEVRAAPDLNVARMVPQPFDNTLQDAMKLPTALGELTKNLSPSLVARAATVVFSGLTLWWAKR